MKTCTHCQRFLPADAFTKQRTGTGGLRADCKECHKAYTHSPEAIATAMLGNQRKKSLLRGHPQPAYTSRELLTWMLTQSNFQSIYDTWKDSGYISDLKPSCDRKDDYKPYTLTNIRLTTVKENVDRYYSDAKRGINTKTAKAVLQYSMNGDFIQEFHSLSAAARSVSGIPSNINQAINGTHEQAYGYRWKTKDASCKSLQAASI